MTFGKKVRYLFNYEEHFLAYYLTQWNKVPIKGLGTYTVSDIILNFYFVGDLCFRSGDILVSDKYGYLYFKVRPS